MTTMPIEDSAFALYLVVAVIVWFCVVCVAKNGRIL